MPHIPPIGLSPRRYRSDDYPLNPEPDAGTTSEILRDSRPDGLLGGGRQIGTALTQEKQASGREEVNSAIGRLILRCCEASSMILNVTEHPDIGYRGPDRWSHRPAA